MLKKLYEIEDPYAYRERLTMPKFIVNAAGDEFFLPDSSQFFGNMPRRKSLVNSSTPTMVPPIPMRWKTSSRSIKRSSPEDDGQNTRGPSKATARFA